MGSINKNLHQFTFDLRCERSFSYRFGSIHQKIKIMNKKLIITFTVVASCSLMAFSYVNWKTETTTIPTPCNSSQLQEYVLPKCAKKTSIEDIFFKVDIRFASSITKDKLHKAKSIRDIYPEDVTQPIEKFESVKISLLPESIQTTAYGEGEWLNQSQMDLLKQAGYSSDFFIKADYGTVDESNNLSSDHIIYYMSVVPETQASYTNGTKALNDHIKQFLQEQSLLIDHSKLEPGKIRFTVSKESHIKKVMLESTCGYSSVDASLIDIVKSIPGSWTAARNANNEAVEQELVLFYGIEGC